MKIKRNLILMLAPAALYAQATWSTCASGGACWTSGNVGIGTTAPYAPLQVQGSSAGITALFGTGQQNLYVISGKNLSGGSEPGLQTLTSSGYNGGPLAFGYGNTEAMRVVYGAVGIGTTAPNSTLEIMTASTDSVIAQEVLRVSTNGRSAIGGVPGRSTLIGFSDGSNLTLTGALGGYRGNSSNDYNGGLLFLVNNMGGTNATDVSTLTEAMRIQNNGNVGIGTTSPQHLLHVAGTIGAEEIIVSSTGADYVFDPDYKLQPLSEVADYVAANHHLPDIPSAQQMKDSGLSLGQMQSKLLAKIEELTLHMVEAEKRAARLESERHDLQAQIREIRSELARQRGRAN